jgi:perosamine synthetase
MKTGRVLNCEDPTISFSNLLRKKSIGNVVETLESRFNRSNVYYCANARTGIFEVMKHINFLEGDEILMPSFNCGSEVDPAIKAGAKIVLYNVNIDTSISLEDIKAKTSEKTKAIYIIHYFGIVQPNIAEICEYAEQIGAVVIEDCALSLFSELNGRPAGSFGAYSIFCFYKFFPSIGGGALVDNTNAISTHFKNSLPKLFVEKALVRAGLQTLIGKNLYSKFIAKLKPDAKEPNISSAKDQADFPDMPQHYYYRTAFNNSKISSITKALLERYDPDRARAKRKQNFEYFAKKTKDLRGMSPLFSEISSETCPLSFPILVDKQSSVCEALNVAGIAATPWWSGYHSRLDWQDQKSACFLKNHIVSLPIHQYLDSEQIDYMVETLEFILKDLKAAPAFLPTGKNMQIECFESLDGPLQIEWEGFLENSKNQHPRQLPVFANIEKEEGNTCYFIIGRKENTISAVALASLVPSRIFNNKFSQANILSGPIVNNEDDFSSFINNLKKQTIFKNVGRLNVSPYWLEEDAIIARRILKDTGFSSAETQPFRKTGIVDLTRSEDEIFASFSKSARRETRRAERQEITVQPITDKSTYLEFLALLNNLRQSRHLSELDPQRMAFSFENFYKKGENGIVLCALHEKTVVAGLQIYRSNVTAHGRHFAGDTEKPLTTLTIIFTNIRENSHR